MKNLITTLREFIRCIEHTKGGIEYDNQGVPYPIADEWPDLALAYIDAKKALSAAPILLRRDGPEKREGLRPYDIILQRFPDEYRVTRLYTDDLGGYGIGHYHPFLFDEAVALLDAVKRYQNHY